MSNIADPANSKSLSHRFRSKRDRQLKALILSLRGDLARPFRILDVGGGVAYWERVGIDWLVEHRLQVVCMNYDDSELLRDASVKRKEDFPIRVEVGDARQLSYPDMSFDLVHSNSVVEHVGGWRDMVAYAREVRRLAPSYYVQTPYFWFPMDPHFFRLPFIHWLPNSLRLSLHRRFKLGWGERAENVDKGMEAVESNVMLDKAQFRCLFPDASFTAERFLGLTKSLIAVRQGPFAPQSDQG